MEKLRIALTGVGGYGGVYLNYFERVIDPSSFVFAGVVDPYADKTAHYERLRARNIPIYDTLEEFYANNSAELMIISTPVRFHKQHSITAMANGSHVLCEKPLVPTLQEAEELKKAQKKYNRLLGVGFQLSYSKPILDLKRDILNGEFGKPLEFKSYSSWRRYDEYYLTSDWKGRLRTKDGEWILDAVSTNATAHYLFNMFFMSGEEIHTSKMPVETEVEIYKAKDIETYDTCFVRGIFDNGCKFFYFSTHSGDREMNPVFSYKFENAVVTMSQQGGGWEYQVIASYKDGRTKNYGDAMSEENSSLKVKTMMSAVRGETVVPCGIDTVMPHIVISNAIFDQAKFHKFPESVCYRSENPPGTFVHNLVEQSLKCYEESKFPSDFDVNCEWAAAPTILKLDGYKEFSGRKL